MLGAGAGSSLSLAGIGADKADTPILVMYRRYVAPTDQAAVHVCGSNMKTLSWTGFSIKSGTRLKMR
ncbi:hypothetical protein [Paracoccus shanxieyensis]|uniref:Uncharacterized protein n=1 Tax=Paracoccus shanxieyensis TaxID=2675752 RepID=A0A6L6J1Q9_9RHOB|nr:hypothetical protein [Paracoccus shanxieyensis]MTH65861.1 hypothetical protein [Paracoccus shanxieyensis]MTH89230.1 hypothetical protein [Paracoccus shanxieyensis]